MATKPKPKPDPEPEPEEEEAAEHKLTLEEQIAAMHYHVADGNAPPELPGILETLLERINELDTRMRAPPVGLGKRP